MTPTGDPAASSHWRELLAKAENAGTIEGVALNFSPPRRGIRSLAHRAFQSVYERLGRSFPSFTALNQLSFELAKKQRRDRSLDMLRQALTLACVADRIKIPSSGTFAVIGDGFGTLSALILARYPDARVLTVNLSRMLVEDLRFIRMALPDLNPNQLTAIEAMEHRKLREYRIDVAFNVVSMQEMDRPVIADYFDDMRAACTTHFYCCNRLEKRLPDGTVTRLRDYPWHANDQLLIDELCPWNQSYYDLRLPFFHKYDGPIWHRLAQLA